MAVRLGAAPAGESYLRGEAIVEAAIETRAEAIHPGYGFLAERASFAAQVEAAGLVFVGPSSATIAALGDKLAARRVAGEAGVPVVPGTLEPAPVDRPDQLDEIVKAAERVGYPLLVKAAAGGGGRGMRRVERRERLPAALASGSAEARPRSATDVSISSASCGRRGTSRSSSSAITTVTSLRSESGIARCSGGTRSWSRSRRHPG